MPSDLARNHRHRIGGEADILLEVESVDRFDKTDAADLKQIVCELAASGETLHNRKNEAQIGVDKPLARLRIARFRLYQKRTHLFRLQTRQTGRVDICDLNFLQGNHLRKIVCPSCRAFKQHGRI